ncbi:PBECR4 domain-containing protein [Cetobacterium sp.]|uniref:PBECR4 domain-containing protein n=1 Tax=Cetobacterium sp. TaxID=2071632 RepID=UPI003F368EF3
MPERYLGIKKATPLNKIDLDILLDYFKKYLCSNIITFTLEDETSVRINFIEDNFPHLIGLHKVNHLKRLKAGDINKNIISKKLSLADIMRDKKGFSEIKDRIQLFPTLDSLIKNASILLDFDPLKCKPFSKIEADFLIFSEEIKIIVYLAVRSVSEDKKFYDCYPVTFLVDKHSRFEDANFRKRIVQRITIDKKLK